MLKVELTKEFMYEALEAGGGPTEGTLAAKDSKDAIQQIRDMGLFPTKVREILREEKYGSYLEYLSELLGDRLIEWGNKIKGNRDV